MISQDDPQVKYDPVLYLSFKSNLKETVSKFPLPLERIDERNLSTPKKTTLVPTEKTIFEPSADKIALNPDRGVILVERQNNSEGS